MNKDVKWIIFTFTTWYFSKTTKVNFIIFWLDIIIRFIMLYYFIKLII